ncbi:MAG: site-specific integrase [Acidimicrobiales bacterium]|nr:site-specific integrase [Acidimicrobiales bacterium]
MSVTAADRKLTIGRYVTRDGGWLESRPWRPSTREAFDSHWRAHLEPRWGDVPLVAVRPTDAQGWVNKLAQDLAPSTVEALYRRLVTIMRAAHADGVIARQPLSTIVLPERPRAGRVHVPTAEQVGQLAAAMSDRYRPIVWTIATLGLRPAEAIGLTVERVDFLRGSARIDRQMVTVKGGPRLAPLKTRRMPSREVPVPRELTERLAAHLEAHPAIEAPDTDPHGGPAHLIFSNNDGRPIRRNGLGWIWTTAAEKIGLPDELRGWHCLRHYAITRLIGAGVNPDYVRQFAGHSNLTETMDTYAGWWPSEADNARDVLSEVLARSVGRRL